MSVCVIKCVISLKSFEAKHQRSLQNLVKYTEIAFFYQKAVMLTRSALRFGLRFVIHLNHELLGFENHKATDSIT